MPVDKRTVDAAVCTVRAPPLLLCLVDLDVRDVEAVNVQALDLCVAQGVLQQPLEEEHALLGPAALAVGATLLLGLRSAANATAKAAKGDDALLGKHRIKVLASLGHLHVAQGKGCLAGVLKMHTQFRPTSLCRGAMMHEITAHGRLQCDSCVRACVRGG